MTKLFITGATGYIGGDALSAIANAHPELSITALVRNSTKGAKVAAQYPSVRLVYGDLSDTALLQKEATDADVVLHTAHADDLEAAKALVAGLTQRFDQGRGKGYLIHTSGTGILCFADVERQTFGIRADKVFDDWEHVSEVTISMPDSSIHRNVDKVVLEAGTTFADKIGTAIVAPPLIFGPGRGPDNQKSIQAYRLAAATLTRGKGVQVGDGRNIWNEVHVQDLSYLYLALVTAALKEGGKATWGAEGYYFCESGEVVLGELSHAIAKDAYKKGLIPTDEVDHVDPEEANKLTPWGGFLWGTNSRSKAVRARELLGWKPTHKSVLDLVPEIVDLEAKDTGVVKGHAVKAAGEA